MLKKMNCEEINIPVPWGVVAAKVWGNKTNEAVIVAHGYQDNANSFDPLIPLLPSNFYYICIDFPGHGKSTPFPTATTIYHLDFVLCLKVILDYLKRPNYILIGHSFGSSVCTMLTQIYPERISKLVSIDNVYFIPVKPENFIPEIRYVFETFDKWCQFKAETSPSYDYQEIIDKLRTTRVVPISEKGAKILASRMVKPDGDKFKLINDQHLKFAYRSPFSFEYVVKLFQKYPIKCPYLLILASESTKTYSRAKIIISDFLKFVKFEIFEVEGDHNVHIEYPEVVSPILTKFLLKGRSKL